MDCTTCTSEIKSVMPVTKEQAKMLPLWKLRVKSITVLSLKFELRIPQLLMNSEIISIDCSILDTPYTKYDVTRVIRPRKWRYSLDTFEFEFEFNFRDGIYHTLFHSFNGKFNYDNNYQTLNQCFEKAIKLEQSVDELINDYNTLTPNELSFKLKFQVNKNDIKTIKQHCDRRIFGTRRSISLELQELILWSNLYFPNMCIPLDWYARNYSGIVQWPLFQQLLLDDKENAKININYSTKNIFVGLNELMTYYEQIRLIIQNCVEKDFKLKCIPDSVLNILFEYTPFDKICPMNREKINRNNNNDDDEDKITKKYITMATQNYLNNNYIGYYPKIHDTKNCINTKKTNSFKFFSDRMTLNKFANLNNIYQYSINLKWYQPRIGVFYDTCNIDYRKFNYNILYNKWIRDDQFSCINKYRANQIASQQLWFVSRYTKGWPIVLKFYNGFNTWINQNILEQRWIMNYQMYCNSILFRNGNWQKNNYFNCEWTCQYMNRFSIEQEDIYRENVRRLNKAYCVDCYDYSGLDEWNSWWCENNLDAIENIEKRLKKISLNIYDSRLRREKKYNRKIVKKGKRRCKRKRKRKRKRTHKYKHVRGYPSRQSRGDKRFKKKQAKHHMIGNKSRSTRQFEKNQTRLNRSCKKIWTNYLIQLACDEYNGCC